MAPALYYCDPSPPSRTVLLVARAIGLDLDLKVINLLNKEQLSPEFQKINPQHTIPTLVDTDITLGESHAISTYLVERYASNDSLYPKDLKQRALVDQRLYFDATILFPRIRGICAPVIYFGKTTVDEESKKAVHEGLSFLEKFLEGNTWVAGNKMTLADFACATSVSSFAELHFDISKYPNVNAWFNRCQKEIPGYAELNLPGAQQLGSIVLSRLQPNQL